MADVFISFPWETKPDAEALARELDARGISSWIATQQLDSVQSFQDQILDAIKSAKAIVFLLAPSRRASPWQQEEYMAALDSYWADPGKLLIPVLIGNAEPPPFLRHLASISVTGGAKTAWQRTADSISKLLRDGKRSKPPRKELAERSKRMKTIEQNLQELRADEGHRLLLDAVKHLDLPDRQEDRAAVELLARHVRKFAQGRANKALKGRERKPSV